MYINKLDDIVNEFNNTYHRTIKMKSRTYYIADDTNLFCSHKDIKQLNRTVNFELK